jgi:serine/threonine protein kinase
MEVTGTADPFGLIGTVLERKYRVDRTVAEGGFGIVYAGHHLALDVPVAVKILKRRTEVDNDGWQDLLARFVQEAQTMARLRHPAIVSVLDAGVAEVDCLQLPWIVLEWLDGVTLRDDLDRRRGAGGRPAGEALEIVRPVVAAVAEAHAAQVAHRDLKPSNVMLVPGRRGDVTPRVLDFGVAKIMVGEVHATTGHTTTADTFRAFSLGYAAPEQIAGARTGPWTDVHALGLILTELLVDAPPYSDEPTEQHARAFDAQRPTPARFGVDAGPLEAIIARAVALRPPDRFADAGELLAALDGAAERASAAPVVRDGGAAAAVLAAHRRRRAIALWTGVGVAAVAAIGVAGAIGARGDRPASALARVPTPSASPVVLEPPPAAATATSVVLPSASTPPSAPSTAAARPPRHVPAAPWTGEPPRQAPPAAPASPVPPATSRLPAYTPE